jgi:hypothetical protein
MFWARNDAKKLTRYFIAVGKGIAHIILVAGTDGHVIAHATIGIDATGAGTGVHTVLIEAGPVGGTVVVDDTLWPTVGRAALHAGQAGAVAAAVARVARRIGIWTTGVRLTRIISYYRLNGCSI